jgi:hypothetical protein
MAVASPAVLLNRLFLQYCTVTAAESCPISTSRSFLPSEWLRASRSSGSSSVQAPTCSRRLSTLLSCSLSEKRRRRRHMNIREREREERYS